jgi:hypothetical protein
VTLCRIVHRHCEAVEKVALEIEAASEAEAHRLALSRAEEDEDAELEWEIEDEDVLSGDVSEVSIVSTTA